VLSRTLSCVLAVALVGCSAGPAAVSTSWDAATHAVRITFETEGRNTFTVGEASCTAKAADRCSILLPAADLPAGWSTLGVGTRRRTGMDPPLSARVFLGDDAFAADCDVVELPGDPASWRLRCTFPEGFSGLLAGRPMAGGEGTVGAAEVPLPEGAGIDRPLVQASLPLQVVNRAGASWPRRLPVVLPVPFVQLELSGWQPLWYDPEMPLHLRAEPGAEVVVDGRAVPGADTEEGAVVGVPIRPGANRVEVEARLPGRAATRHSLLVTGSMPDTPLYLERPRALDFTTSATSLRVAGRSSPDAKIYVDTRRVPEVVDGRFDVEIPLVEGTNEMQVIAVVDGATGGGRRPPTRLNLHVVSGPAAPPAAQRLRPGDPASQRPVLEAASVDPWSQVGAAVTFPLVVDSIARTPTGETCRVRIDGLACSEEARRPVRLGFGEVVASACAGIDFPAVVDLDDCPTDLEVGDRIGVAGAIDGAVGGRVGLRTVERPLIRADAWRPAPWTEPPPPVEGG
jgi:hypothetical protein